MHPFLCNIIAFLIGCTLIIVWHMYREANSAADWVASYVAEHSEDLL